MKVFSSKWCAGATLALVVQTAWAAGETRADIEAWLGQNMATVPAPGSVLTQTDLEINRALIAPGYFDYVNHPDVRLEIEATADIQPHSSYLAATAAHGDAATLRAEGGVEPRPSLAVFRLQGRHSRHKRLLPDNSTPERALETSVSGWRGSVGVDVLLNTTTIARATSPTEFPTMTEKEIERRFALSALTEGRLSAQNIDISALSAC